MSVFRYFRYYANFKKYFRWDKWKLHTFTFSLSTVAPLFLADNFSVTLSTEYRKFFSCFYIPKIDSIVSNCWIEHYFSDKTWRKKIPISSATRVFKTQGLHIRQGPVFGYLYPTLSKLLHKKVTIPLKTRIFNICNTMS